MKLQKFSGINNVQPAEELAASDLTVGVNVDLDLAGQARRRAGFAAESAIDHRNLWDAGTFTLATRGASGDLVNVDTDTVLVAGLGHTPRVWYCNLPGGRVIYSNGVSQGVVTAAAAKTWGVPIPAGVGSAEDVAGDLHPGDYQHAITYQRLSDGAEGGPAYSAGGLTVALGGISLTELPTLAGYRINVYLTSHFGGERFLAGSTTTSSFAFTGENKDLQQPCRTEFLKPPPAGKLLAFWRGRTIVAVGKALFASKSHSWELFDLRRDFKPFSANITLVQPVDGGVWVGTEEELCFLAGEKWDSLVRVVKMTGPVVLGSGVAVPGEQITMGKGRAQGRCMVCIADGWLVAGGPDGSLIPMSMDRYRTDFAEVSAAFRMAGEEPQLYPQYIAIEQ